jgi:Rrf2 family iron-sulfur cluster assembly transcriptional regulator
MCHLAFNEELWPISARDISFDTGITEHYLDQLFFKMRKKNLIHSVRGPGGGYVLARPATQINLLEIIESVEGPIVPVWCVDSSDRKRCIHEKECPSRDVWSKLQTMLRDFFRSVTLSDLISTGIICRDEEK